jgi:hypothetical protein
LTGLLPAVGLHVDWGHKVELIGQTVEHL